MDDFTLKVITATVAVYGALLSTYIFVTQRLEKGKRVRVTLSHGFVSHGPALSKDQILLEASNIGHRPVNLSSYGIILPKGGQILMPSRNAEPAFPCELTDGKKVIAWIDTKQIADLLREHGYAGTVKLVGEVRDGTGKTFRSKPFALHFESWLDKSGG